MKQLLNTLYVTTSDCRLNLSNHGIEIHKPDGEKTRVPLVDLESILCFGSTTITTPLMAYCAEKGVSLSFFSEYGRFQSRVEGPTHGSILLRKAQFHFLENQEKEVTDLCRKIVDSKLANSREILLRSAREMGEEGQSLKKAASAIAEYRNRVHKAESADSIRGLEGAAAAAYFGGFSHLIREEKTGLRFEGREQHPPKDPVNGLLSYLYTLLTNDAIAALEAVGLDPQCGFFHSLRPGKPSLALDMVEPFRSPLCDRLALALIHRKQITPDSFLPDDTRFTAEARHTVLSAWQSRKAEEIFHPELDEKIPIGLLLFAQARLLARYIRGEAEEWTSFRWR